jgi:hypothetical protein
MRLLINCGYCGALGTCFALLFIPVCRGEIVFWLSSDQDNGCFDCILDDRIAESIELYPNEPVVLTIWATLGDTQNLTGISLWLDTFGTQSLEANAVWMFNPLLHPSTNTYRHQVTIASDPASFVSPEFPLSGDHALPFCNKEDQCAYVDVGAAEDFGAASISLALEGREGVGVGEDAKALEDPGYVEQGGGGQPDLWKIGLIELFPIRNGTITLELLEGEPILHGSPESFANYSLDLTVEVLPDYNRDGAVNIADYAVWRDTLGTSMDQCTGSDFPCADGNTDGVVDVMDYVKWKQFFGFPTQTSLALSVPEPASALILLVGIGLVWLSTYLEAHAHVCSFRKRGHR